MTRRGRGVDTDSLMDARSETVRTLDDCREAVEALRRAVDGPLVRAGMDAERVRALAQHLDGAFGVLDAAVQTTPAYQEATLLDGAPRAAPGRGRWPAVATWPNLAATTTGAPRPDGPRTSCSAAAGDGRSGQRAPRPW